MSSGDGVIPRLDQTRGKKGSVEDGTAGCHILSNEITNHIYSTKPGPKFSSETEEEIAKSINQDDNIELKSAYGTTGNCPDADSERTSYDDRTLDIGIMEKYKTGENLSKAETKRALKQSVILLHSKGKMPDSFLKAGRDYYHKLKDQDGKPLIRKNAAIVSVEEGKSRKGPSTRSSSGGGSSSSGGGKSDNSAESDFLSEVNGQKDVQDQAKSNNKGEDMDESSKQSEIERLRKEIQEAKAARKEAKANAKAAKARRDVHITNARNANEELRAKTGKDLTSLGKAEQNSRVARSSAEAASRDLASKEAFAKEKQTVFESTQRSSLQSQPSHSSDSHTGGGGGRGFPHQTHQANPCYDWRNSISSMPPQYSPARCSISSMSTNGSRAGSGWDHFRSNVWEKGSGSRADMIEAYHNWKS